MILFPQDATDFSTYGIGVLSDAVSCIVAEERNGAYELEMRYPVKGKLFDQILPRSIIYAEAHPGNFQPFRVYQITKPIFGTVTFYARHISYDLSGIPVSPFTAANVAQALSRLSSSALVTCPFSFWTDKSTVSDMAITAPASMRSVLGGAEGSILDSYGGEYEYDGFSVKLHQNRGTDNGVSIRYGKNLVDLQQEENVAECYSGIIGYWFSADGLVQGDVQSLGTYPYTKIYTLDLSSAIETQPTKAEVNAAALSYAEVNRIGVPRVSLALSYAQLADEPVNLCDTVHVAFEMLGIDVEAKVVKTEFNSLLSRYETIEIGDARQTIADTIAGTSATAQALAAKAGSEVTASDLANAISRATASITGVAGGYVVIHQDANGKPYEILIMDTDDIDTAENVWRWNQNGLAYSSTGYDGTYGLAMTADGEIVADFITTGTLDASTIDVVHLNASSIDSGTLSASRISQTYTDDVLSQAFTAAEGLTQSVVTRVETVEESAAGTIQVEYALGSSSSTAPTSGWSTTAPQWQAGMYMWQRTVTIYLDDTPSVPHRSISNPTCIQGAKGEDGTSGLNSASVFLYRRSASTPSKPTSTLTYTFATGALSGSLSGWTQTIPATDGHPCYVIQASAASTGVTDTIAASEWSSPVVLVEDGATGATGANGYNTALVYLYKRATSASINWTTTLTYNFDSKVLTSTPSGWSQTIPSGTNPLYVTTATAYSNGSTDSIPYTEWSTPVRLAENGADGVGIASIVPEYYLSTSSTTQTGGSWSTTAPQWQNGKYLWVRSHITWDDGTTSYTTPQLDNTINDIATRQVTMQSTISQHDDDIALIVEGTASEVVEQYARNTSNTTPPTSDWSTTIPTWTENGQYIWKRYRTTMYNGEYSYSTPVLVATLDELSSEKYQRWIENVGINSRLDVAEGLISAKVSTTGGAASSFGWELTNSKWELKSNNQTVFKAAASGVEVTGKVTATSGSIGGFEIGTNTITSKSGTFYVGMGNSTSGAQAFWAGAERADQAPFRVDHAGNMYANTGTFKGTVYAGSIASGATPGYISSGMCDININNALANAFNAADIFAGSAYATYMRVTGSISTPSMYFNGYQVRWGTVDEGRNVLVRNS